MIDLGYTRRDSLRSSVGTVGLTLPMKRMMPTFLVVLTFLSLVQTAPAEGPQHRKLSAVPFTEVKIQDTFWSARQKTNREASLPHNFQWCEKTGRFSNFEKAGKKEGRYEGPSFNDSDVYKVIEGAAYSLADKPDKKLDKMVDDVIDKIVSAQEENGYLNAYYTLQEPDRKWTDLRMKHELYCAGHMFEAAVAHYRVTGKRKYLDAAIKFADLIDRLFGPEEGKRKEVPGHQGIELALVKLYELTGEERYFNLAKFFIDLRGDKSQREELYGEYCQDHIPVRKQDEIVGHAVRAMYLYAGVADVAGYTGDKELITTMDRVWDSVVLKKMYITGGLGVHGHDEGFSGEYVLPNSAGYAETCASIGMAMWNHRLNLMHADAKYVDILERAMYNSVLSGIHMGGKQFFYSNRLGSAGHYHRSDFFDCACCPTNVLRFVPSVPGYVYATGNSETTDGGEIYVNLYIAGEGQMSLGENEVSLKQETGYPWDGKVKITVDPKQPGPFTVKLRLPDWCEAPTVSVDGKPVENLKVDKGYASLNREWKSGDTIELNLPMEVVRIEAHPKVKANAQRVSLRRGPVVYCFEAVDNNNDVASMVLARDPKFTVEHRDDLLGGVTVIKAVAQDGSPITAVPYYAWDHREPGGMAVWVRQEGQSAGDVDDPSWKDKLYRALDPATLGKTVPPTLAEKSKVAVSHVFGRYTPNAVNDGDEPDNSADVHVERFAWFQHPGTKEWIQYAFPSPQKLSAVEVYWYQHQGCETPESWKLLYKNGDEWKEVPDASGYGTEIDKYNRVTFTPVEAKVLRIEVQSKKGKWSGILEWKVESVGP